MLFFFDFLKARKAGARGRQKKVIMTERVLTLLAWSRALCGAHPGCRHQNQAGVLFECLLALVGSRLRNGDRTAGLGAVTKKEGRRRRRKEIQRNSKKFIPC
jgi:hypothetical protein